MPTVTSNEVGVRKGRTATPLEGGAVSKHQILTVAAAMFASLGYSETTMRQIASRVGMKSASLYYHFTSKEAILTEILDVSISSVFAAVKDKVERLPKGTRPSQKIRVALEAHVRALYEKPDYTSTAIRCAGQLPRKTVKAALPAREKYRSFWTGLFAEADHANEIADDLHAELLQTFLLHAVNRTLAWFDPKRGNVDELLRIILTCFSACLRHADKSSPRPRSGH